MDKTLVVSEPVSLAPLTVLQEHGYQVLTLDGNPLDYESLSASQQLDLVAKPSAT